MKDEPILKFCWQQGCITWQSFVDGMWVCSECGLKTDPLYAWQVKETVKPPQK